MLGYDAARRFLMTKNAEERDRIALISRAATELQRQRDLDRATMIANAVGRVFGG
jgi:hypothetical protein